MTATISDIGEGAVNKAINIKCEIAYPSGEKRSGGGVCLFSIGSGETKKCSSSCGYPLTEEGKYTLTMTVDSDNWITESNENNNEYSKTVQVT
jgi:hypothetical protein